MNDRNLTAIKALTFVMFMMFAMTTDSVGIIIPEIVNAFHLSLTASGSFQYATMGGIALAGFLLGHLADRIGRKPTIIAGLTLFAASSYLFIAGNSFWYFCALMALSGAAIGIFKTAALALIGDIVTFNKRAHLDHEHRGRLLRRRFDHRPRNSCSSAASRSVLAMALRDRGNHVRAADRNRRLGAISRG